MAVAPGPEAPPAPPSRRSLPSLRLPSGSLVVGAGLVVWGLSIGLGRLSDNSFLTHLATGRYILDHGIPHHDIYSFTAAGQSWVVQSWLASVLYAWVESWFGAQGIRVLMGITAATLAGLIWRLTRPSRTLIGRLVVAGCVVGVGSSVWSTRPLLLGLVFLALTLLVAERGLDPRWLIPIFWLWVNVHGSFPLGLVALGCLWLGRRADGQAGTVEWRAMLWGVAGTVLGVVGPLGPILLVFPVRLLGRSHVLSQIVEWQSPNFTTWWSRLFLLQVVLAILALARRPSFRAAIPMVVFVAAALIGVRNVAVASLVLVPGMSRGLRDLGSVRATGPSRVAAGALAALVVVALVMARTSLAKPAWDLESYPVDAFSWMDQQGLLGAQTSVATPDFVGNYLELVRGTDARAYLDDRVDMYPDRVVDDYLALQQGGPGWRQVLADDRIDLVVWPRRAPLTGLMAESSDWRTLYSDATFVVTCHRGAALGGSGGLATC